MKLYEKHHIDLSRFCSSLISPSEAAKDVMGETLLRAFQNMDKLQQPDKFKSYLFAIASNVCKEFLRKYTHSSHPLKENINPCSENFGEQNSVQRILSFIPPKQAEVFMMYEVLDYSLETISDILNIPISTVKTRLRRARLQLESLLSDEFKKNITHF